jgi:hypothetical protein
MTGLDGANGQLGQSGRENRHVTAERRSPIENDGAERTESVTWTVGRACNRSSTGAVQRTAGHEVRVTRMSRRACNRSRAVGDR